jgi:amino acid permease
MFVIVIIFANMSVFQTEVFSWFDFITGYVMMPVIVGLYIYSTNSVMPRAWFL